MSKQYHNEEFKRMLLKQYKSGNTHASMKDIYKQTAKQQKKQSHPFRHQ